MGSFGLALIAPVGTAIMGLMIGSDELFLGGVVFTLLILFSRFLRSRL